MQFTPEEIMVLFVIGFVFIAFIIFIIKKMFTAALFIFLAVFLFGFGFGWLPKQIDSIKQGEKNTEEVVNEAFTSETVHESIDNGYTFYEENKDDIWDTVTSSFNKLYHLIIS